MKTPASALYRAWTRQFDKWFAAPGTVSMDARVNKAFFFETVYTPAGRSEPQRHPHYGRFLRLETDRLVEVTWVTGAGGTEGAEAVVTVEIAPAGEGGHIHLTHAGFATAKARDQHQEAWPLVLEQLDQRMSSSSS